jgi:predicted nucleic acid-binding protein
MTDPPAAPVFVDTTALVRRYVRGAGRDLVLATMTADAPWCASALARTEVLLALRQVAAHPRQEAELGRTARDDWDSFWVVPVDGRCLAAAVEIGARFGLRTVDAVHLAAADRLPRPLRYLTFDRHQIPAAAGLGFEVISPLAS